MTVILWLIAASLIVAVGGLIVFFWSVRSGQYEDLKGASMRILLDDEDVMPPR
jgi:cbb3-type cytochrome oxidase maturation protein